MIMESEHAGMWSFWRDKRGIIDAIRADYPNLTQNDPEIRRLVETIDYAEAAIDRRMSFLEGVEDE